MKKFIKQHSFIILIAVFSLISTAFLYGDYHLSNNKKAIANISTKSVATEINCEDEEFESSDFNIFKNISEAIDELFSLGF